MIVQIKSKEFIMSWLKKKNYTISNSSWGDFYAFDTKSKSPCFNPNMLEYCNRSIIVNLDSSIGKEWYQSKEWVWNRDWFFTIKDKVELIG